MAGEAKARIRALEELVTAQTVMGRGFEAELQERMKEQDEEMRRQQAELAKNHEKELHEQDREQEAEIRSYQAELARSQEEVERRGRALAALKGNAIQLEAFSLLTEAAQGGETGRDRQGRLVGVVEESLAYDPDGSEEEQEINPRHWRQEVPWNSETTLGTTNPGRRLQELWENSEVT